MQRIINIILVIALIVALIFINKQCNEEPEIITETVTKVVTVHDTITKVEIQEMPKPVYVEKIKTVKGKDSIIYVDKPTDTSIQAKQYDTELKSNKATAKLKIMTSGELLDVKGVITYPEKETLTTITKKMNKGGLFIYGESSVQPVFERAAIGLDWQIKNKFIIGSSFSYNNLSKSTNFNIKVGIKIL